MNDGPLTVAVERPGLVRLAHEALDDLGVPRSNEGQSLALAKRVIALREMELWPLPEVMGSKAAAAELGVAPSNLQKIVGLPEPAYVLERGSLWRAQEIRKLARERAARGGAADAITNDPDNRGS